MIENIIFHISSCLVIIRLILPRVKAQVCKCIKVHSCGFNDPLVIVFSCLLGLLPFPNIKISPCTYFLHGHAQTNALGLIMHVCTFRYILGVTAEFHFCKPTLKHSRSALGIVCVWVCTCLCFFWLFFCFLLDKNLPS